MIARVLGMTLALSSSLCGGCADYFGGLQTRRLPLLTVLLGSQLVALLVATLIVVVSGAAPPDGRSLILAALGGAAIALALACLYRALAIGTMMLAAPIAAAGAVVPVIVGFASGERPGLLSSLGIVAALVGVILTSRGSGSAEGKRAGRNDRNAFLLALLSAAAFGAFFVFVNSSASSGTAAWTVLVTRASFVLVLVISASMMRPSFSVPLSALAPLAAIGVLDLAAVSLFAFASRHGTLSVVSVLASFPPLVTVMLARMLLKEHIRRGQAVGVGVTLLGVCLIAAG